MASEKMTWVCTHDKHGECKADKRVCECSCHETLYTQAQMDLALRERAKRLEGRIAFMLKALELAWPRIAWADPTDAAAVVIQDALATGRRTEAEVERVVESEVGAFTEPSVSKFAKQAANKIYVFMYPHAPREGQYIPEHAAIIQAQVAEAIAKEREKSTTCWHCAVVLESPSKPRCEDCPDECDVEGCDADGCAAIRSQELPDHR